MLKDSILNKRCIMVCGGGGVGKTTIAASIAISAARVRKRVLVVTIDPAKRLLEAFGFHNAFLQEGGEPLSLSPEIKSELGLTADANLSIAVLNPKYVLNEILEQALTPEQAAKLKHTVLFSEISQMIYGLQEYTAYEWVTRMIQNNEYDLIVLDTPPAAHAKDFFGAPDKIKRLMESRVFQIFLPKKSWFGSISFAWMEKLLGNTVFGESKIFFEVFTSLRGRILDRCDLLAKFFKNEEVAVVAVSTLESSAQVELNGLMSFLSSRQIPVQTVVVNQVEPLNVTHQADGLKVESLSVELQEKISKLRHYQDTRRDEAKKRLSDTQKRFPHLELIPVSMNYSQNGFEILKVNSEQLA